MEATKQQLASIFNGSRILEVPFYQRSYVWQEEQWKRFLEDMEFVTHCKQDYFLGSIILKKQYTGLGSSGERWTIIDGQQRLTTLMLFAKVYCLKSADEDDKYNFTHHFTVKDIVKKDRLYALNHSLNDRHDFERVLSMTQDTPIEESQMSNIIRAYNYFHSHIDLEKLNLDVLMSHLIFIAIDLQEQDDEQVIFDTINSLGVRLTTAELLKNYFFSERTREEYEELWQPIFEKDRDVANYWENEVTAGRIKRSNIDAFFSAFLAIKIQDPKIGVDAEHKAIYRRADAIFSSYKDLISTYNLDKETFFYEVVDYAEKYRQNIDPDIAQKELPGYSCVERINFLIFVLDCSTLLPYVLYIVTNVKDEKERNAIFDYLESYIVRRTICKSDSNNFSDLFGQQLIGNKITTFEALRDYIENRGEEQSLSLPKDSKVKKCLIEEEHPNKRALAVLYLMESRLREGKPYATKLYCFDEYSLEHLLPKRWEKNWPLTEGYDEESRKHYINTLGNMSLLPQKLNSSISNATWSVKLSGNKKQTGLKLYASDLATLKDVTELPNWNEVFIRERAKWLASVIAESWPSYLPDSEDEEQDSQEDQDEETSSVVTSNDSKKKKKTTQDHTKYSLNDGDFLSKAEFVFNLVKQYVSANPDQSYTQLKKRFNDNLCPPGYKFIGFLCTKNEYDNWSNTNKHKRYLAHKEGRLLTSSDGIDFYVNSQWTLDGMTKIVKIAKEEGFKVTTQK